jgi:hypothetical protein
VDAVLDAVFEASPTRVAGLLLLDLLTDISSEELPKDTDPISSSSELESPATDPPAAAWKTSSHITDGLPGVPLFEGLDL